MYLALITLCKEQSEGVSWASRRSQVIDQCYTKIYKQESYKNGYLPTKDGNETSVCSFSYI